MNQLTGFKKILQKFWIRKDRETYLLSGVIITTAISAFVSSYWHYADRMEVANKININIHLEMAKEKEFTRFKEAASYSQKPGKDNKQYYTLEENPALTMPKLYDEEPAPANEPPNSKSLDNSAYEKEYYRETDEEN